MSVVSRNGVSEGGDANGGDVVSVSVAPDGEASVFRPVGFSNASAT